MSKKQKRYTIIANGVEKVSLDSITVAREGLEFFGGNAHIRYNEKGIKVYEKERKHAS